jgi:carbon storage regulator
MLVLSRKPGEKLQIGNGITITVLEVRGRVLKLGVEAPNNVRILRGELSQYSEPRKEQSQHEPVSTAVAV